MGLSRNKIALIATLTTVWPSIASPQAGGGGLQVDLGLNTSFKADDNYQLTTNSKGNSLIWDTRLNFGISSVTDSSNLSLTGSGVLRVADFPGRNPVGLEDPTLRFSYSIESQNSRLTVDARYRHADREYLNPFQVEQEEQNSGGLVGDGGTVTFFNTGIRYETGLAAPFGLVLSARHDQKDYSNVTNTRLFDNETDTAGVTARFDISPVTQVTATANETWYTAEDAAQTDRNTFDFSLGLRTEVNPTLILNAALGHTEIDTTKFGNSTNRSGLTGSVGLTQTLANGDVGFNLSTVQNVNGSRTTLQFSRTLQMQRSTFAASLGLTKAQNGSTDWVGRVAYSYQMKSSNFNASLSRASTTNNLDEDIIDTRIALGYGYEIDSASRIDMNLNYGLSEDGGAGSAPRVERATFDAAYTRALTSDWNLRGGITIRNLDDSSASGPAHSNAIYLSLGRNFSFRP